MKGFELPSLSHGHPVMGRDMAEAPEDATAAVKFAIKAATDSDPAMSALVVTAVGHTALDGSETGYSIAYGFQGPVGYKHLQAAMTAIPHMVQDLSGTERLMLALSIIKGDDLSNYLEADYRLDRDHGGSDAKQCQKPNSD